MGKSLSIGSDAPCVEKLLCCGARWPTASQASLLSNSGGATECQGGWSQRFFLLFHLQVTFLAKSLQPSWYCGFILGCFATGTLCIWHTWGKSNRKYPKRCVFFSNDIQYIHSVMLDQIVRVWSGILGQLLNFLQPSVSSLPIESQMPWRVMCQKLGWSSDLR